jgi:outer membrane protein, heavy metal efflux system
LNTIRIFCLGLLAAGLVCGCAHYEAKPISPEQTATTLENLRLDNPGLRKFLEAHSQRDPADWPPRLWDFETLALAALYYHPDLEVARAEWDVARAGIQTAGARPNPTLSVTPGYNFNHINAQPGLSPWVPIASLDVPIETAGKRNDRIRQANAVSESARLNIAATAWRVRSAVRSNLLNFIADGQRAAMLQKQAALQEQIVTRLEQQVAAGAVAASEVRVDRIALEKAKNDLADAQRQRAENRVGLAEAIGVSVSALDGIELATNGLDGATREVAASLTTEEVRHAALLGRADILGALADYAAAEAVLQLEVARQYPDVHWSPGYEWDQGDNIWNLGLTVELPMLNRNQGPIAEAIAKRTLSAAQFNALQSKVLADIDSAVESFHASESSVAQLQSLANQQAKSRDAIEAQLKAGAVAPLDLLNAQIQFAAAEVGQLEGRIKMQQSLAALEDAVQRPIATMTPEIFEKRLSANEEKKP